VISSEWLVTGCKGWLVASYGLRVGIQGQMISYGVCAQV
jgi:hypothetical protein